MKGVGGKELQRQLEERGIVVVARSIKFLPEEQPEAYKSVEEVVRSCERAGLSLPVVRLKPLGVLKG
jgi:tRNA-splicing ligase RtcB